MRAQGNQVFTGTRSHSYKPGVESKDTVQQLSSPQLWEQLGTAFGWGMGRQHYLLWPGSPAAVLSGLCEPPINSPPSSHFSPAHSTWLCLLQLFLPGTTEAQSGKMTSIRLQSWGHSTGDRVILPPCRIDYPESQP